MFLRPFRDLAGRQEHALEQRAAALEIEMLVSAIARLALRHTVNMRSTISIQHLLRAQTSASRVRSIASLDNIAGRRISLGASGETGMTGGYALAR